MAVAACRFAIVHNLHEVPPARPSLPSKITTPYTSGGRFSKEKGSAALSMSTTMGPESPILLETKRHANLAHAVRRVLVLQHEPPNFLGEPVVTGLRQDQFLLSKFVPVLSDDIAKMIEKIIDHLAELQSRPRTISVLGHDTLGVEDVWHHVSWPQANRGEELPARPTRRHIPLVHVCSHMSRG